MSEDKPRKAAWSRQKTTRKSVIISDALSRFVITAGGVGTIIAVLGVCLFLLWVAVPLFQSAEVITSASLDSAWAENAPLGFAVDEYQTTGWALLPDGNLHTFLISTGEVISKQRISEDKQLTAASFLVSGPEAVFGYADGSIQTATVGFETSFLDDDDVPPSTVEQLRDLPVGEAVQFRDGVVQLTPEGQYRAQKLSVKLLEAYQIVSNQPVLRVDHVQGSAGQEIAVLTGSANKFRLHTIQGREKKSFMSGKVTFNYQPPIEIILPSDRTTPPDFVVMAAQGSDLYTVWADGELLRTSLTGDDPILAERGQLIQDDAELRAFDFVLGDNTLVWGDTKGRVQGGFLIRLKDFPEGKGLLNVSHHEDARFGLAVAKRFSKRGPPISTLGSGTRSRLVLCGYENGAVKIYNVTTEGIVARDQMSSDTPVLSLAMAPKEDGLLALGKDALLHSQFDPMHPEASLRAMFRPVWYEGYTRPQHMWQSSSGTDDFEMKLGLMPLIFGTIKATFYSMLFGAPLALLAAIYSSEFLSSRVKATVKPTIELMASLPSVVLGFLAALVFAPFIEKIVPATLTLFVLLPVCFLFAAYTWQMISPRVTLPLQQWRIVFMLLPVAVAVLLAAQFGPLVEQVLFAGDIKGWLSWDPSRADANEAFASGAGGWMILWLPLSAIITALLVSRVVNRYMRNLSMRMNRGALALADMTKFIAATLFTLALAWGISHLLSALGFDPRGSYIDTFVQRNSLVVGMVMGFAIIPIIYTLSDDALSTVPDHLRGASLGAGATKWQTAVRVIIPTAMSGLFSAMMIGLGRAVGETMIVLMAAGNTPIMEWNIFEGFRTLSANIAVELPEAVKDSTHYRTLFMAALVLFAMTFVVNTVAEIVRLRFRKRAVSL